MWPRRRAWRLWDRLCLCRGWWGGVSFVHFDGVGGRRGGYPLRRPTIATMQEATRYLGGDLMVFQASDIRSMVYPFYGGYFIISLAQQERKGREDIGLVAQIKNTSSSTHRYTKRLYNKQTYLYKSILAFQSRILCHKHIHDTRSINLMQLSQ